MGNKSDTRQYWKGEPLVSYEKALKFIRTTKTATGLKVKAYMVKKKYEKNQTVSVKEMSYLSITKHEIIPEWNYTISPSKLWSYFVSSPKGNNPEDSKGLSEGSRKPCEVFWQIPRGAGRERNQGVSALSYRHLSF